jgi:hypothetical protein
MMVALFAHRIARHAVRDFMEQNCGFDAGFGNANSQPRCSGLEGSRGTTTTTHTSHPFSRRNQA